MIKVVTIVIDGTTQVAVNAAAARVVNGADALAAWANTSHPGLLNSIKSSTQDVTVVKTKRDFINSGATLVLVP